MTSKFLHHFPKYKRSLSKFCIKRRNGRYYGAFCAVCWPSTVILGTCSTLVTLRNSFASTSDATSNIERSVVQESQFLPETSQTLSFRILPISKKQYKKPVRHLQYEIKSYSSCCRISNFISHCVLSSLPARSYVYQVYIFMVLWTAKRVLLLLIIHLYRRIVSLLATFRTLHTFATILLVKGNYYLLISTRTITVLFSLKIFLIFFTVQKYVSSVVSFFSRWHMVS